jgi:hypothetical protein
MAVTTVVTRESIRQTPPLATYVDNIVLAGVAKTVTVPAGASRVIFGTTATPYYVRGSGTASAPSGDVVDGTGSAINPSDRLVSGGATFSIFAAAATISLEWHIYSVVNG